MARFIVITSGKGGVGKTTTAVNLANALSILGEEVVLLDANFSTPNVGLHLGAPVVPVTLNHVLMGKADLIDSIYEHESGTKVIPSSLSIKDMIEVDSKKMSKIARDIKKIAKYVIVDSAAGLGEEAMSAIDLADDIIIVTNPEMPAVTDALKAAKIAESRGKKILGVIVTRYSCRRTDMSLESIKEMLELPILGVVPEDKKIKHSLALRNSVVSAYPWSKASRSFKRIAAKLSGRHFEESFFDRLLFRKINTDY